MRRITPWITLSLLLLGLLTLVFNTQPVKADWWGFKLVNLEVEVTPERPGLSDLVNVTVSFTFGTMPPSVKEFGPINRVGNTFFINATVYLPAPQDIVLMVVHTDKYVYHLGNLSAGEYKLEVYVQTIHYCEGYWPAKTVVFTVYIKVPDDYPTIQEAINHANESDTIYVRNGTYNEHLYVDKPLTLAGESNANTIVNGTSNNPVVYISADNVTVKQFTLASTREYGANCVYLNGCRYNNVIDNKIYAWDRGICLQNSHENALLFNGLGGEYHVHSIDLYNSDDNIIMGNVQEEAADVAVNIVGSCRNLIASNKFDVNQAVSIIVCKSNNNAIIKNTIAGWGGIGLQDSNGTRIYHNNIASWHDPPSSDAHIENSFDTFWDNGCEGNYWSSYKGTDSDGDGIGDTPYIIGENNTDMYPLMNLYWDPSDVNHDLKVDIRDIAIAALAFGSYQGQPQWNPHTDITGPTYLEPDGKVDIRDIALIAINYGKTYP